MLIGLDVGGTFTDAVILSDNKVIASSKHRTTKENLLEGILAALDAVLPYVTPDSLERVTLSTTVVTNRLVEHKESPVDLYIVPGPGVNLLADLPARPIVLQGYTDHQGKISSTWSKEGLSKSKEKYENSMGIKLGCHKYAAVSAKFSVRNPEEEQRLAETIHSEYDFVSEGAKLSGALNFVRRTVSAYYNSAVLEAFIEFKTAVEEALASRYISAPLYILKADGGSWPIAIMSERPVESAFTGPAASVLGIKALGKMPKDMVVALDIGGTTTDISLWRDGEPLMARGGVDINDFPSAVRSFQVKSVGIGGESAVSLTESGEFLVGPERLGPSVALGGSIPTLGDALIVAGQASYGDRSKAEAAIASLALTLRERGEKNGLNQDTSTNRDIAEQIIQKTLQIIKHGVELTINQANRLPVYTVKDIVEPNYFKTEMLMVVGGTAQSLGHRLGEFMKVPVEIPPSAEVANAIGAALAKETLALTLRLDTSSHTLVVPELGLRLKSSLHTTSEVIEMGMKLVREQGLKLGLIKNETSANEDLAEVISIEDFPVVQGWQSTGHLITVQVQLKAGVKAYV